MSFTQEQRHDFLTFLKAIEEKVASLLAPRDTAAFFSILVDYSVDEKSFELKIAELFYRIPEKLDDLRDSIRDISTVRKTMLHGGANANEALEITLEYFREQIDEFYELADFEDEANEDKFNAEIRRLRLERKSEKAKMEAAVQKLQEERQKIFESEKEERKKIKDEKKSEEKKISEQRQKEHEDAVEERKLRQQQIEEEIATIQKKLQSQHETEIVERKERKTRLKEEMKQKQEKQQAQQDEQAKLRREEKEREMNEMKARQSELHEEREKQAKERKEKKQAETDDRTNSLKSLQEQQSIERKNKRKKGFFGFGGGEDKNN